MASNKRKRLSLPVEDAALEKLDAVAENVGPGISQTNVAVMAVGIGIPVLEALYCGKPMPAAFPEISVPRGRGRPPSPETAHDVVFPSTRSQQSIAELGARAKLLGFKIVDVSKQVSAVASKADQTELDRLIAPAPKPAPDAQVPGQSHVVANVVGPAPEPQGFPSGDGGVGAFLEKAADLGVTLEPTPGVAIGSNDHPETQFDPDPGTGQDEPYIIPEQDLPKPSDFVEEPDGDEKADPDPETETDPELVGEYEDEPPTVTVEGQKVGFTNSNQDDEEADRRDQVKEKLTELLEAGVPIEEAYEKARAVTSDDGGNGGSVTPLFGGEEKAPEIDPFKCTHGVRFDAPEQCGACVTDGF